MRTSCYTDEVGQEVLSCFLDFGDSIDVLGPNQATRVYYLQKGNEEFLVEYNSYYCELNGKYFTTPDGQFLYVLSKEDGSITIYSWQLSQGSYIDFDLEACVYAVFEDGNSMGYLPTLRSDDSFPQPFDEPVTPPWGAIQD